jgi:N-formylglutamate deformylase
MGHPAFECVGLAQPGSSMLVFDSPHSWRDWNPSLTPTVASGPALRSSCDAWVDELWAGALRGRAPLLAARFHRAFIDANRARDDIDPELLDGPWPGPLNPGANSLRGMGLIRRLALPDVPMYATRLPVGEVQARIAGFYDPYHQALQGLVDAAHAAHGLVCHVNCHSMKSVGNGMNTDAGRARPDIVVSDRDGSTADPFLLRWIVTALRRCGYHVQVNHPYRGAELVRRHGQPAQRRYSVQIEINRALYMDEAAFERHAGFDRLQRDLGTLVDELHDGLRTPLVHPPSPAAAAEGAR